MRHLATTIVATALLLSGACSREPPVLRQTLVHIRSKDIETWRRQMADSKRWWATSEAGQLDTGLVCLRDGTEVRLAFLSHHQSQDGKSHTRLEAPGYERHVTGGFCCEVEFGDAPAPPNLAQFDALLSEFDGVDP